MFLLANHCSSANKWQQNSNASFKEVYKLFYNFFKVDSRHLYYLIFVTFCPGLEIATDAVTNATNIFSLATKNSGLVATLATRFLYDLDLN